MCWGAKSLLRGFVLAAVLAVGHQASAQQPSQPLDRLDLKQQHDILFAATVADPANVDTSFRYAEVATKLGDFEAAIGALERIIFYNPNLPRVRLELGVLYFRLGSYEMARSYFESAIAGDGTPIEVKSRVAGFLSEIDRRLQTTQFSFSGQAGLRYQSNANAGPNSTSVRALGFDATLNKEFARRPDWNGFAVGGFRYVYDFGNQRGDVFEAQANVYGSRQFKIDRLNTAAIEASVGPRLAIAPDALPGWSVKPYAIGSVATLADRAFLAAPGVGVTVAIPTDFALFEPGYEWRHRSFRNSTIYPTARDQRGAFHVAFLNVSGALLPELRWFGRLSHTRADAHERYAAYDTNAIDVGLLYDFAAPFTSVKKWTASATFGLSQSDYRAPHIVVDPVERRKDKEWRIGLGVDAPIWEHAGFAVNATYTNVSSSLPNYRTRNFSLSLGPTVRF